jgi:alpha-tubulin suppressor-like RCC1 family protein
MKAPALLGAMLAFAGCSIEPILIEGRRCPCPDDYTCDAVTERCRRRIASDAASVLDGSGDSGAPDAGSDADVTPACTMTTHWRTLASGRRHACAIKGGTLYCWGDNDAGQLGNATGMPATAPVPVALPGQVVHVSSFDAHVCALLDNQQVHCWGGNDNLQSGKSGGGAATSPTQVGPNFNFITVSTGTVFTCGLGLSPGGGSPEPELLCWGARNGGSLADQNFVGSPTESPVPAFGEENFVDVTTGLGHGCGAKPDGRAFCWGYRQCAQYGELYSANPVPALGGCVTDLAAQADASCFIDGNANLYCLGGHAQGGLGIGPRADGQVVRDNDGNVVCENAFPVPQQVLPGTKWKRLAGGFANACAISANDELYCWGSNEFRAVENTAAPIATEPVLQQSDVPWSEVAVGFQQICARPVGSERVFCKGRGPVTNASELAEVEFFAR